MIVTNPGPGRRSEVVVGGTRIRARATNQLLGDDGNTLLPFASSPNELAGIGSFLKKIKKAVSIKNVVKVAKKVAPIAAIAIPFGGTIAALSIAKKVGGVIKSTGIAKKAISAAHAVKQARTGFQSVKRVGAFVKKVAPVARALSPALYQRGAQAIARASALPGELVEMAGGGVGKVQAEASGELVAIPMSQNQVNQETGGVPVISTAGAVGGVPAPVILGVAALALLMLSKKGRS